MPSKKGKSDPTQPQAAPQSKPPPRQAPAEMPQKKRKGDASQPSEPCAAPKSPPVTESGARPGQGPARSAFSAVIVAVVASLVAGGFWYAPSRASDYPELSLGRNGQEYWKDLRQRIPELDDNEGRAAEIMYRDASRGYMFLVKEYPDVGLPVDASCGSLPDGKACCCRSMTSGRVVELAQSFVCDGIYDCCDGADEKACVPEQRLPPLNESKCHEVVVQQVDEIRRRIRDIHLGVLAKQKMLSDSVVSWPLFQQKVEAMRDQFEAVATRESTMSEQQRHELRVFAHQLVGLEQLKKEDFGRDLAYLPLLLSQSCFEWEGNEKNFRGGCASPVAHDFVFRFCPYGDILQTELPNTRKRVQTKSNVIVDDDDDEAPAANTEHHVDETAPRQPVHLGSFRGWKMLHATALHTNDVSFTTMQVFFEFRCNLFK
ncbi:hypothetical protein DIPPA_52980 [Diplonema papillatum]|nr:hypothetical protein DIPPA_52980 [Diplonema papillatum]